MSEHYKCNISYIDSNNNYYDTNMFERIHIQRLSIYLDFLKMFLLFFFVRKIRRGICAVFAFSGLPGGLRKSIRYHSYQPQSLMEWIVHLPALLGISIVQLTQNMEETTAMRYVSSPNIDDITQV